MILGIGTDIVAIDRIRAAVDKSSLFMARILTEVEQERFHSLQNKDRAIAYLAKRFAAKEAAVKALGTGIGNGVGFHDFCVVSDELGKPELIVTPAIEARFDSPVRWHVSLTDEKTHAQAFVIVESTS